MLSHLPSCALHIFDICSVAYEDFQHLYAPDPFFSTILNILQNTTAINQIPFLHYTLQDGWLNKINQLHVPHNLARLLLLKEVHSSDDGHFHTFKTLQTQQRYFHWPSM